MKLWLVRHAQVALPEGICYGASDVPVHPDATRQAAAQLARQWPKEITLWHSTLSRCELLALSLQALQAYSSIYAATAAFFQPPIFSSQPRPNSVPLAGLYSQPIQPS